MYVSKQNMHNQTIMQIEIRVQLIQMVEIDFLETCNGFRYCMSILPEDIQLCQRESFEADYRTSTSKSGARY